MLYVSISNYLLVVKNYRTFAKIIATKYFAILINLIIVYYGKSV